MVRRLVVALLYISTLFFGIASGFQFVDSGFKYDGINSRFIVAFFTGISAIVRMFFNNHRPKFSKDALKKEYANIIGTAFSYNDKDSNLLLKALLFYNIDKCRKAISILKKLLQRCKSSRDFAVTYIFLGLCYKDLGQSASAKEAYEAAIQKDPTLDTAHSNLGIIHKDNGNLDIAIQCFETALAINRESCFAYNNLAAVYIELLNPDKAIEYALEALSLRPNMYQAMNTLALAYSLKNDKYKAEEFYKKSVANGCPHPKDLKQLMNIMHTKL